MTASEAHYKLTNGIILGYWQDDSDGIVEDVLGWRPGRAKMFAFMPDLEYHYYSSMLSRESNMLAALEINTQDRWISLPGGM